MLSSRLLIYSVVSIAIVFFLIQLNSYLAFVSIPNHEQSKDYAAILTYISSLSIGSLLLLFHAWYQQVKYKKAKLLGHTLSHTQVWPWLYYEWRIFQTTLSIQHIFKILMIISLNLISILLLPNPMPEDNLQVMANRTAQLAMVNTACSVLLSAKRSFIQQHFFSLGQTIRWHVWFGRIAFIQVLYHGTWQLQFNYEQQLLNVRYVSGTCMLAAFCVLTLGSHPLIRTLSYKLFRVTHLLGFFVLICFGCLHHGLFYVFYAAVVLFWITDQLDRSYKTEVCHVEAMPGDIVRISCDVPYSHSSLTPGQFAYVSFFSTSWWKAWFYSHPFSIARIDYDIKDEQDASTLIPKQTYYVFYIKANGSQTRRLYDLGQSSADTTIKARISKPLGRPFLTSSGTEFGDFETIVLVAEGVGITPWICLLGYIQEKQHAIKTQTVHLIWSIHVIDTFYAFEKELEAFSNTIQLDLQIQIYITGLSDPEENYSIPHNLTSIKFKASFRPNYPQLFHDIQGHSTVALGVCAHESTMTTTHNLAVRYDWPMRKERFEL
ncbi:uncharacterized protein B0P05DRAFT_527538 [Gilbertella persicaria]|uniref:uncharacterized protein n=1 Tax=Gilbertella persicaria TaxID=101096 RepID=UPI0022210FD4|nr:uncharacterized protein B0P05DRAFT_527538 [Gilbertella persicaria]KAI8091442.1 hypothetical protein B0P05DRAFT_527538 [Gilbertella persicaria]